jgi:hypothetical protein
MPGAPLIDIMTPEGVVETILSEGWGIVAHVEGGRIFSSNKDDEFRAQDDDEDDSDEGESGQGRSSSGGIAAVFGKGDVICHIVGRDNRSAGKKAGLHPRPSPHLRRLRLGEGV